MIVGNFRHASKTSTNERGHNGRPGFPPGSLLVSSKPLSRDEVGWPGRGRERIPMPEMGIQVAINHLRRHHRASSGSLLLVRGRTGGNPRAHGCGNGEAEHLSTSPTSAFESILNIRIRRGSAHSLGLLAPLPLTKCTGVSLHEERSDFLVIVDRVGCRRSPRLLLVKVCVRHSRGIHSI